MDAEKLPQRIANCHSIARGKSVLSRRPAPGWEYRDPPQHQHPYHHFRYPALLSELATLPLPASPAAHFPEWPTKASSLLCAPNPKIAPLRPPHARMRSDAAVRLPHNCGTMFGVPHKPEPVNKPGDNVHLEQEKEPKNKEEPSHSQEEHTNQHGIHSAGWSSGSAACQRFETFQELLPSKMERGRNRPPSRSCSQAKHGTGAAASKSRPAKQQTFTPLHST